MSEKEEKNTSNKMENSTIVPQPYPIYVYPEKDEIDLREIWKLLFDNRLLLGKITGVCTLFAVILAFSITPVYRAETLLAPVEQDKSNSLAAIVGQFGGLAELAGINAGGLENNVDESIATLKSRELTASFLQEEGILPILFPNRWDDKKKKWKKYWWDFSDRDPKPTNWAAYNIFDKDIREVSIDKKTGLVTVSIEWKDPELAAKWANDIVARVNKERQQDAIEESVKRIKYLEDQLQKTGVVDVQQSLYKLIEAQTKTKMIASTREEYAFKVIDPAVIPERKSKPKRILIIAMGFFLGAILAFIFVFVRKYFGETKNDTSSKPQ